MTKAAQASHSSDSTTDTLVEESLSISESEEARYVPPPTAASDRPPQRYGTNNYGNQPAAGYKMQALWPSAGGKNVAGANLTPLWPPNSLGNQSSFDVLSDTSIEGSNVTVRNAGGQEYRPRSAARDFKQTVSYYAN